MMHVAFFKDVYPIYFAQLWMLFNKITKKRVLYVVLKCFPVGLFKLSLTVLKQEIEVRQTLSIESIGIYPCITVVDYKQLVEICLIRVLLNII